MGGDYVKSTTSTIGHLRQQQKLIGEMRSTCPKLVTQWVSMGNYSLRLIHRKPNSIIVPPQRVYVCSTLHSATVAVGNCHSRG
jgi:hypothetical protein